MWFVLLETFYRYGFGLEMTEESGAVSDWWRMLGIGIDKDVGTVALTRMLSGRCHIDFCNCLIHSELLNSVWISGQKIGGNPRLK